MAETRLVALIVIVGLCITGWFVLSDTDTSGSTDNRLAVTVKVAPPYQQSRAAIEDVETTGALPETSHACRADRSA